MLRLPWKRGPVDAAGRLYVIATRFVYRNRRDLPMVFVHGLLMRARWDGIEGAAGVFLGADARARATYTVSAWRAESDLRAWLRSPAHARVARAYGARMESSLHLGWEMEAFEERLAWREGMERLGMR